jgi:hypothetical protein
VVRKSVVGVSKRYIIGGMLASKVARRKRRHGGGGVAAGDISGERRRRRRQLAWRVSGACATLLQQPLFAACAAAPRAVLPQRILRTAAACLHAAAAAFCCRAAMAAHAAAWLLRFITLLLYLAFVSARMGMALRGASQRGALTLRWPACHYLRLTRSAFTITYLYKLLRSFHRVTRARRTFDIEHNARGARCGISCVLRCVSRGLRCWPSGIVARAGDESASKKAASAWPCARIVKEANWWANRRRRRWAWWRRVSGIEHRRERVWCVGGVTLGRMDGESGGRGERAASTGWVSNGVISICFRHCAAAPHALRAFSPRLLAFHRLLYEQRQRQSAAWRMQTSLKTSS